jgi:hypothetical protein
MNQNPSGTVQGKAGRQPFEGLRADWQDNQKNCQASRFATRSRNSTFINAHQLNQVKGQTSFSLFFFSFTALR